MKRGDILKYAVYFVLFVFLFFAEKALGVRPFAVAFFFALVYSKQSLLFLAPLYIGAAMIVEPTLIMLLFAGTPVVVAAAALFIHYRFHIKLRLYLMNLYLFAATVPFAVFGAGDMYEIVSTIISVAGAQAVFYAAVAGLYAVVVKKLKYRLTAEETFAAGLLLAVLGMGLYAAEIAWYNPFYTLLPAVCLVLLFVDKKSVLFAAVAMGIGGALVSGAAGVLALAALYGLAAMCFNKETHYFAAAAMVAADVIFRAFFAAEGTLSYYTPIAPAVGALLICVLPNKWKARLQIFEGLFAEKQGGRTLINRDRRQLAKRLETLSGVFFEIQDILHIENRARQEEADVTALAREVSVRYCENCVGRAGCKDALGGNETEIVISDLVAAAIDNGRATILDTPSFLSSRCRKINGLISAANDITERYKKGEEKQSSIDEGRALLSEQMGGVGYLFSELKKEMEAVLSYDAAGEKKLMQELHAQNIAAGEAVLYAGDKKPPSMLVSVREDDAQNNAIQETVSRVVGVQMDRTGEEKLVNGMVSLQFEPAPVFQVVYGERDTAKEEGEENGDRLSAIKIAHNKVMLILSDGMGSGKDASRGAGYAMSMLERFYRAGFDHKTVAAAAGRLLSLRAGEAFNAVDIAVIDTAEGAVDFIKMGGRESFLVHKGGVEVIECGSLPMGILNDESDPIVERRKLQSGTFIVLVSDGVIDTVGREGLVTLLSELRTANPDMAAAAVMADVQRLMESADVKKDDASVLVAKIYKPIS